LNQGIANENSIYTWEVSLTNTTFHPLRLDSIFTSTASPELQTAYLQPGLYVRCTAQAVNHAGVKGYSRTSEVVQLNEQRYQCSSQEQTGGIHGTISTYQGFEGVDEVRGVCGLYAGIQVNHV
jgi:hypothetical protein